MGRRNYAIKSSGLRLVLIGLLSCGQPILALSEKVAKFLFFETQANEVSTLSNKPILIEHFEIPLSKLDANIAERMPGEIRSSLIFNKDEKAYLRWVINPIDTQHWQKTAAWLTQSNLDSKKYHYFNGYLTASSSIVLEDPKSHAEYSVKVSTNHTAGLWRDKPLTRADTWDTRLAADLLYNSQKIKPSIHFVVLDEPAAFALPNSEQAMIVRSLKGSSEITHYLPGFSALHSQMGKAIAEKNAASNTAAFWDIHYNQTLARALAELAVNHGVAYDSPHYQNLLIEQNGNFIPTGRIVLRDIGDSFSPGGAPPNGRPSHSALPLLNALFLGGTGKTPTWLTYPEYKNIWVNHFFEVFENSFCELAGKPPASMKNEKIVERDPFIFEKVYPTGELPLRAYMYFPGKEQRIETSPSSNPVVAICDRPLNIVGSFSREGIRNRP